MPLTPSFRCGLVVGKFSPLHRGHDYLIRSALQQCEEVLVISYSNPEYPGCGARRRRKWITALFPDVKALVLDPEAVDVLQHLPHDLRAVPLNRDDERLHRRFTGALCTHLLGRTVDAVFTSEAYGDGLAEELTRWFTRYRPGSPAVRHCLVDQKRCRFPVSGTVVRQDPHARRAWLPPQVYASFVRRVCLLGGESSGKSSLALALADHFKTVSVAEYGRELWEVRGGRLAYKDMLHIAQEQVARENLAAGRAMRFLFCDTSPLTTLFYSRYLFGKADGRLEQLAERAYDLVVLCEPDFPFVQDGTRQPETFRKRQHAWYLKALEARGIDYLPVGGSLQARVRIIESRIR